jgi:hypothetical protein
MIDSVAILMGVMSKLERHGTVKTIDMVAVADWIVRSRGMTQLDLVLAIKKNLPPIEDVHKQLMARALDDLLGK